MTNFGAGASGRTIAIGRGIAGAARELHREWLLLIVLGLVFVALPNLGLSFIERASARMSASWGKTASMRRPTSLTSAPGLSNRSAAALLTVTIPPGSTPMTPAGTLATMISQASRSVDVSTDHRRSRTIRASETKNALITAIQVRQK